VQICNTQSVDQAIICATIAAGACLACGVIPMLWGLSLDRKVKKLGKVLRETQLQRLAYLDEMTRWRALYYTELGVDVQSRKTQVWRPPPR
jgi:hypothetical protein